MILKYSHMIILVLLLYKCPPCILLRMIEDNRINPVCPPVCTYVCVCLWLLIAELFEVLTWNLVLCTLTISWLDGHGQGHYRWNKHGFFGVNWHVLSTITVPWVAIRTEGSLRELFNRHRRYGCLSFKSIGYRLDHRSTASAVTNICWFWN